MEAVAEKSGKNSCAKANRRAIIMAISETIKRECGGISDVPAFAFFI